MAARAWPSWIIAGIAFLMAGPAAADVTIATASPMTGRYAWFGEQFQRGAELAVRELNAAGGVLGQKVRLFVGDDSCNPEQAKVLAQKVIELKATLVVGHGCSGPALATAGAYEAVGVLMITPSASNPRLTESGWRYVFRLFGRDDEQGALAARFLAERYHAAPIAIVYDETVYSRELAHIVRAELNSLGIAEALFRGFEVEGFDWARFIDNMEAAKIQVVYFAGRSADVALLAREAADQDYELAIVGSDPLISEQFWLVAGEAGQGTVFTSAPDPRDFPSARAVVERFREEGYEPEGYTLHIYSVVQAWAQAVERTGAFDADAVSHALRTGRFGTAVGTIGFNAKGDVTGLTTFVWYVWKDGRYAPLSQ